MVAWCCVCTAGGCQLRAGYAASVLHEQCAALLLLLVYQATCGAARLQAASLGYQPGHERTGGLTSFVAMFGQNQCHSGHDSPLAGCTARQHLLVLVTAAGLVTSGAAAGQL
jgi:hypothetical protein